PTDNGITPLFAAAWAGHTDVLQALIDSGADVDCAAGGAAPLYGAARHGQLCVLVALLDGGAAVDGTDSRGETPLLAAAERGNWDVARALL
ncbi:ankyrin repeat-containing domain protein, partial [Pelagophyceae sp. CCMP2097]